MKDQRGIPGAHGSCLCGRVSCGACAELKAGVHFDFSIEFAVAGKKLHYSCVPVRVTPIGGGSTVEICETRIAPDGTVPCCTRVEGATEIPFRVDSKGKITLDCCLLGEEKKGAIEIEFVQSRVPNMVIDHGGLATYMKYVMHAVGIKSTFIGRAVFSVQVS